MKDFFDYAPAWVENLPKALSIDGRGPRWSCNAFDLHRDVDGSFLPLSHFFDAPPKQRLYKRLFQSNY